MNSIAPSIATPNKSVLPNLLVSDGTIEAIKWIAVFFMLGDHINKYFLHESVPVLYILGRLCVPLFGFVLAYNLARHSGQSKEVYSRVIVRLALFGALASVPFIAFGGLIWGWYPLNIMFAFLVSTTVIYFIDNDSIKKIVFAFFIFIVGGFFVEFWWPGVALCVAAWAYCRRPSWISLFFWIGSIAILVRINGNWWALASIPIICMAPYFNLHVPRIRKFFYIFYPLHLAIIWLLVNFR